MVKILLLASAILTYTLPSFAQISSSVSVGVVTVESITSCRYKILSKYFDFDTITISDVRSNFQSAIINNMEVRVWCKDTQAVIAVYGYNHRLVNSLREEIQKIF